MLTDRDLKLRTASENENEILWNLIFGDPAWKEFDAPYYPLEHLDLDAFTAGYFERFVSGEDALLIEVGDRIVGSVTFYWEDKATRWLEIGIVIYTANQWGREIGRRALRLWTSYLFDEFPVERIGLTTWSGNPRMVSCAQSLGFEIEGRLRKVRYYQQHYYDSIKMGVLRSEWQAGS